MASENILILGGTREAATLASNLVAQGHDVTSSLAGRTKEPAPLAGKVRVGGFGGVEGLVSWIGENRITRLIDATHPFAKQISANAREAARLTGVAFDVHERAPWEIEPGDNWIEVDDLHEAARTIPAGARVLLALGSQHLRDFESREDVHFLIRMIDKPDTPLNFADHTLLLARPSSEWPAEADLMKRENITHIVCRNSGGTGAYAKIEAARQLGLTVIILKRG